MHHHYPKTRLEFAHQQMPGFFVGAVFGIFEVGGEDYCGLLVGGADGEDVPGVGGDDEGGEEVELVGAVDDVAGADRADVGVGALVDGALDLHAAEEALVIGDDVVGGGFSPGLVAAESALGGALHETEFGPLSAEFGMRDVWGLVVGHSGPWGEAAPKGAVDNVEVLRGAEAPLFHGRARCWVKVRGKVKIKGQDQSQRSRSKSKVKIKVKGSGQECPLHTIASFWWVFGDIRAIKNAALEAAFCFSTIRSVYHKAMVRTGRFAEDIFAFESGRYREFSGFCLLTGNS